MEMFLHESIVPLFEEAGVSAVTVINKIRSLIRKLEIEDNIPVFILAKGEATEIILPDPEQNDNDVEIRLYGYLAQYEFEVEHELYHLKDFYNPDFHFDRYVQETASKKHWGDIDWIWDVTIYNRMGAPPPANVSIERYQIATSDYELLKSFINKKFIPFEEIVKIAKNIEKY